MTVNGWLIDSNIFIDIARQNQNFAGWSAEQLKRAIRAEGAALNQIIYAEVVLAFGDPPQFDTLYPPRMVRRVELPWEAAEVAARAYQRYLRYGGKRPKVLPDFYIGAHAQVAGCGVMSRDPSPFRTYFPNVPLITVEKD